MNFSIVCFFYYYLGNFSSYFVFIFFFQIICPPRVCPCTVCFRWACHHRFPSTPLLLTTPTTSTTHPLGPRSRSARGRIPTATATHPRGPLPLLSTTLTFTANRPQRFPSRSAPVTVSMTAVSVARATTSYLLRIETSNETVIICCFFSSDC